MITATAAVISALLPPPLPLQVVPQTETHTQTTYSKVVVVVFAAVVVDANFKGRYKKIYGSYFG